MNAPIVEQPVMQPILVGGGELVLECFVQELEDLRVTLHACLPRRGRRCSVKLRWSRSPVRLRDELEMLALAAFLVDDFLRVIEAAAALNLAADASVGFLGRGRSGERGLAHVLFGDSIANAHDHAVVIDDNAKHSQEGSAWS